MSDDRVVWTGIDVARAESDRTVLYRSDGKFVAELLPGDDWRVLPDDTIVIANPAHPIRFVKI